MLKEVRKPLLLPTIQKELENNKIVLRACNDGSNFVNQKLSPKVHSKDMSYTENHQGF